MWWTTRTTYPGCTTSEREDGSLWCSLGAWHLASHIADDLAYVRRLVEATLERLGPAAQGLHILDISTTEPVTPPRPGLQTGEHLRITVGPGPDLTGLDTIGAHFSMTVPRDQATLATVDQVQEHVI